MADEPAQKESKEKLPAKHVNALSTSGTHAVIVAQPPPVGPSLPVMNRRQVVIAGFWTALGLTLAGIAVATINFMWPRTAQRASGVFQLELNANDLAPGEKRDLVILQPNEQNPLQNIETKLFIVRLSEEQAAQNLAPDKAGAYLALSRKCPHLGCSVPYNATFPFTDPINGETVTGWFRCPCHGSTYSDTGRRVFGPAPRSMDVFALEIDAEGVMRVNVGQQFVGATEASPGDPGNITHAVFPGETSA
jgi:cytochrome b6-f complex iron-sulfur subunit